MTNAATGQVGRPSRAESGRDVRELSAVVLIGVAGLLLLSGCGGNDPLQPPETHDIAEVNVEPEQDTIRVGASAEFSATAVDASGDIRTDVEVLWSTDPESIASIDDNGVATGEAPGSVLVIAEVDGVQGGASLTVEPAVEDVTVTPSTLNIAVGETAPLTADVDGDPENSVSWSSNNTAVATVDAQGNVTGVAEGSAAVTATSTLDETESASATVNVTALEEASG